MFSDCKAPLQGVLFFMEKKMITSQWQGKKVAFLGDSITDKIHIGTEKNYWQFL